MNIKRFIHIVFVLSLILVTGFAATPASASAPIHSETSYDDEYLVYDGCGFNIISHEYGTTNTTIWLDDDGLPYRVQGHWNGTEIWYAEGYAGGKTLEMKMIYPGLAWIEPAYPDGRIVFPGSFMITLPHEGVVFSSTGYLSYSFTIDEFGNAIFKDMLKQVGNWEADWPVICEYLEP